MASKESEEMYGALTHKPLTTLDFMRSDFEFNQPNTAHLGGDWSHKGEQPSDPLKEPKYGMIATQKNALLSLKIRVAGFVHIGYLRTYENIGKVAIWIDDIEDPGRDIACDRLDKRLVGPPNEAVAGHVLQHVKSDGSDYISLDGLWRPHSSLFQTHSFQIRRVNNEKSIRHTKWIHFCLPADQKFKLLSLTAF